MHYYSLPLPNIDHAVTLIEDFLQHQKIRSLSSSSYDHYKKEALLFFSIFEPELVSIEYIHNYISDFESVTSSTKNTRLTALRTILKYLVSKGFNNCDIKLHNFKTSSKLPDVISKERMQVLIKDFKYKKSRHKSIWRGRRDYALLLFMYTTGLRASEIINFQLIDLIENSWVRVNNGKGKKDRLVPIASVAVKALKEYLEYLPAHIQNKHDQVFISDNLVPYTKATLYHYCKKTFGYNPHTFRHTFATHLILNGCNEYVLMDFMGHSDISTTQIYTHIQQKHLKDTVNKHFPKL